MKAFSRFEKEKLEFYAYVTKGNVVVSRLPSVITKRKILGKVFLCSYGKRAQAYVKRCSG